MYDDILKLSKLSIFIIALKTQIITHTYAVFKYD